MKMELEIKNKIKEIISEAENFTTNNFGSFECEHGGEYSEIYSEYLSEKTLIEFKNWLLEK